MKDILSEIIANKRFEVDLQKQAISIEQLQEGISEVPTSRSMKQALASSASGIIAEFKRRTYSDLILFTGFSLAMRHVLEMTQLTINIKTTIATHT